MSDCHPSNPILTNPTCYFCLLSNRQTQKAMPPGFSLSALIVLFFFLCSFTSILAHTNEDPTIKTMEDFSGYPIHESHSHLSSLSVDAQGLEKQVKTSKFAAFGLLGICSLIHVCADSVKVLIFRLMNFRAFRIHLPHQWPGSCILRKMYWHVGMYVTLKFSIELSFVFNHVCDFSFILYTVSFILVNWLNLFPLKKKYVY